MRLIREGGGTRDENEAARLSFCIEGQKVDEIMKRRIEMGENESMVRGINCLSVCVCSFHFCLSVSLFRLLLTLYTCSFIGHHAAVFLLLFFPS